MTYPPSTPAYPQPEKPAKRRKRWPWILAAVALAGVLLCAGIVAATTGSSEQKNAAPTPTHTQARATTKPNGTTAGHENQPQRFGDGTYEVGSDIQAGTYVTTVPQDSLLCYWERMRNFDDGINSIIANENLSPGAHGRIEVKKSDAGVKFNGGCTWIKKK